MISGQNLYFGIIPQKILACSEAKTRHCCDLNINYIKIELNSNHSDLVSFEYYHNNHKVTIATTKINIY